MATPEAIAQAKLWCSEARDILKRNQPREEKQRGKDRRKGGR